MRIATIVCALALALMLDAGTVFAQGNSGCEGVIQNGGGQNSCNTFGLCTAYFAGSETGRNNKKQAPPFVALVGAACEHCEDNDACPDACQDPQECMQNDDECVLAFCPTHNPGGREWSYGSPGQGNGNGNGNNGG